MVPRISSLSSIINSFKLISDKSYSNDAKVFQVFSWNIEGWNRNCHNLLNLVDSSSPSLIFLSEPQLFQCDLPALFSMFDSKFLFHLNSEDSFCPELPLSTRKAKGGTMAMWDCSLDPFIRVLPTSTSAVLPILLSPPGLMPTAHITVYLPTAGRDSEFLSDFAALDAIVSEIVEDFSCPIYFRGDFNVNPKNITRSNLLHHFCDKFSLTNLDLGHPTHHHFQGGGASDAQLDLLLFRGPPDQAESLTSISCSLAHPFIDSHHDLICSSFPVPTQQLEPEKSTSSAPRVVNDRVKITWTEESIEDYRALISPLLINLKERFASPGSSALFDILLASTTFALSSAAQSTCRSLNLGKARTARPSCHPDIRTAQQQALVTAKHLRDVSGLPAPQPADVNAAKASHSAARAELKSLSKAWRRSEAVKRDQRLSSILTSNPSAVYSFLRSAKGGASKSIQKLTVSGSVYTSSSVPDGFFHSLSSLKAPDMSEIYSSSSYQAFSADYEQIMEICSSGLKIPEISGKDATLLLHSLRQNVNDLHSITPNHFINAGVEGVVMFAFLLNTIIGNINLSSLDRLNEVWAMILFKGHNKDRESDRSYRTISTCPLLSKALDKYVGGLCESGWAAAQAETQFQGKGSCHFHMTRFLLSLLLKMLIWQEQPTKT